MAPLQLPKEKKLKVAEREKKKGRITLSTIFSHLWHYLDIVFSLTLTNKGGTIAFPVFCYCFLSSHPQHQRGYCSFTRKGGGDGSKVREKEMDDKEEGIGRERERERGGLVSKAYVSGSSIQWQLPWKWMIDVAWPGMCAKRCMDMSAVNTFTYVCLLIGYCLFLWCLKFTLCTRIRLIGCWPGHLRIGGNNPKYGVNAIYVRGKDERMKGV